MNDKVRRVLDDGLSAVVKAAATGLTEVARDKLEKAGRSDEELDAMDTVGSAVSDMAGPMARAGVARLEERISRFKAVRAARRLETTED